MVVRLSSGGLLYVVLSSLSTCSGRVVMVGRVSPAIPVRL